MDATSATSEDAFHAFEHAGWEAVPRQYDESFAALTVQSIEPLLNATDVRDGLRVLDVATWSGLCGRSCGETRCECRGTGLLRRDGG